jgi:hypothetical protein
MQQTSSSPEKGTLSGSAPESRAALVVSQPPKVEMLLDALAAIDKIAERIGEDRSSDMGGGGSGTGKKDDGSAASTRDQKIANLPVPEVMRSELKKHIEQEVAILQKEIHKAARRVSRPGGAYKLSVLYARLRRLNALISELFEAAYDTVKRLFVKVVIDEQKVL